MVTSQPSLFAELERLLTLAPEARGPRLAQLALEQPELAADLERLLAAEDGLGDYLEPPGDSGASPPSGRAGERFGPWEIQRCVGTGGMGSVWLATRADGEFHRRAALKLIRTDNASEVVHRRFLRERQVLAGLDHPGIARLIDGGRAADGRPYLVMEYVEGTPIDRYADENRLTIPERLALFAEVCEPVHHAHTKLVVHRDLKPSNVLVTPEGRPKLLDFGIAKLLDSERASAEPLVTVDAGALMTPAYASPEQVRGAPVGLASDVYSLGVILYELVTGHLPYEVGGGSLLEVGRVVCETDPVRPVDVITRVEETTRGDVPGATKPLTPELVSERRMTNPRALKRLLSGDLERVLLKALRKEPRRRYASAEHFAEDLRNLLAERPVSARPDTAFYRARKFVRRNPWGVAAAALLVTSLAGGWILSSSARSSEADQRVIAEQRFGELREITGTLLFDLHRKISGIPGATEATREVAETATFYLERMRREAPDDPAILQAIAYGYRRIGENLAYEESRHDEALEALDQAVEAGHALLEHRPGVIARHHLGRSLLARGDTHARMWDRDRALEDFGAGLAVVEPWVDREEPQVGDLSLAATFRQRLGGIHTGRGDLSNARGELELAYALYGRAIEADPSQYAFLTGSRVEVESDLSSACMLLGELDASIDWARSAVETLRPLVASHAENFHTSNSLWGARMRLANAYLTAHRMEEAEAETTALIELYDKAYTDEGTDSAWERLLTARIMQAEASNGPDVAAVVRERYESCLRDARDNPAARTDRSRFLLAKCRIRLAALDVTDGRLTEAENALDQARADLDALQVESPENQLIHRSRAEALQVLSNLSEVRAGQETGADQAARMREALRHAEKALALLEEKPVPLHMDEIEALRRRVVALRE